MLAPLPLQIGGQETSSAILGGVAGIGEGVGVA